MAYFHSHHHPNGRETSRHDRDSSPINDQQGALESNADPCALHDVVSSLNRKRRVLFPLHYDTWFVRDPIFGIQYLCSISLPTNTFTRSRDITSPWPSHTIAIFIDVIITEWAQGIYPSLGYTNPDLDAYVSTYSIGIPDRHLLDYPVTV